VTFGRFRLSHGDWPVSSCGAVQQGLDPDDWKPMQTIGPGVREIRIQIAGAHRVFYVASRPEAMYVLHAFEKRTPKTSAHDLRVGRDRFRALQKLGQKHGKEKRG
jgi:phage-related protein